MESKGMNIQGEQLLSSDVRDPASTRYAPARAALRKGTHPDHVRLNGHPLLVGITRPDYPADHYLRVLVAYFHFYRALEHSIDRCLAAGIYGFDYGPRRKLPWLEADLAFFGLDPDKAGNAPASGIDEIDIGGKGALVGVLYTIEGSSLGGQVISRYLAQHMGLRPEQGGRFFYGYGDDIPIMWAAFEVFMEAQLDTANLQAEAVLAARQLFSLMERVLDEYATKSFV